MIRTDPVGGKPTKRFRARAYYRDFDGVTRLVEASGRTSTQASQTLRAKLQNRSQAGRRGELTSMSRFSDAAALWVQRIDSLVSDGSRSPSTAEIYRRQLRLHVLPAMGELRLGEITTPLVDRVISSIKSTVSPATAKTARSVISGVMGQAVRHGAALANPVREVERIESTARRSPRALEAAERVELLTWLAQDEKARRHDLPELVFFMLATGVRIGEALATVWSEVDFAAGTVHVSSTLVRVRGEGLLRKSTKTSSGDRLLDLPASALAVLQRRFMSGARLDQPLFPDVVGGFRDPSNVRRELREARESAGMPWVTSHTFRKTAATILDEAALSARLIADQLGHSRISMTQDVYLARRSVGSPAALALDDRLRDIAPSGENNGKTMGNDEGQAPGGT
ncbi:Site-specific recombinase XerD [Nocardioides scoriae]|uniref:Site-specific recombinase XerD n=1 Tax=Nocardioides scoriae TaxID=642780 RepID=A0A1H1LNX8_9ACTN|nr:site-specific integrase [Nocardioides scoriae]SDR75765.1 Site-specific recombinase XerD [Nocardioides scoriae]